MLYICINFSKNKNNFFDLVPIPKFPDWGDEYRMLIFEAIKH